MYMVQRLINNRGPRALMGGGLSTALRRVITVKSHIEQILGIPNIVPIDPFPPPHAVIGFSDYFPSSFFNFKPTNYE